ncbi:MAG TPA: thiamine pyrophosphate-binding protein [Planctomycetia bacterium]|nr:thiamine pyrophosphate-binding protein [Planctomycetia bacterium]
MPVAAAKKTARNHKPAAKPRTISRYLIDKLYDGGRGVKTVFGIPGDYILHFYEDLLDSPIETVVCTREDCAGFAADAYARLNGLGAAVVTYCVGGLSVLNATAGAYAEKSPLIIISGSPGLDERAPNRLLHHMVRDYDTQREVFEKITCASATLEDPLTALREIDRVFEAVKRYKRPGYIEIPRDQIHVCPPLAASEPTPLVSDPGELQEALDEVASLLEKAKKPMLMVGVEVHRFGLQDMILEFAEKHQLPMCSTLLGKSAVDESHPLSVGVYAGAMGRDAARKYVEESDCILMVGTFMTDINLGIFTHHLDASKCILVTSETLQVRRHHFRAVTLADFVKGLVARPMSIRRRALPKGIAGQMKPYKAEPAAPLKVQRLFQKLNTILTEEHVVICDIGDSLFGGMDLAMHRRTEFLSPAYYTSMGFAIPAALGANCSDRKSRPVVVVGDGAFQMTCNELSTIHRLGFCPIVIVMNNKGYTTERFLLDGPFNDITNWNYHKVTEMIGGGKGYEVRTEGDLEKALEAAVADRSGFSLLNVHLDKLDRSEALDRLAHGLRTKMEEQARGG